MSTAHNEIVQRTPAQQLVARVREPDFKQQVAMALPPTVTVDRFIRVTAAALLTNPDIAKLDHNSVLRALVQSAAAGLIPDGKEAAIVGRGGTAVYQPMIGGFVKIAAEHGWMLKTKAVYANDDFSYTEEPENIRHVPVRPGAERGDLIGAYAIAAHKDGRRLVRFMAEADIAKRRAQATTQNVWTKWPAEMFEKTAGRDLFADLPLADSDLERERIKRLLAEGELVTDAATTLYGSSKIDGSAQPQLEDGYEAAGRPAERQAEPVVNQQAGGAAAESPADGPVAAPPAPGADPHDEPSLDAGTGSNSTEDASEEDAAVQQAAAAASQYHPPNGQYKHLSLAEILAVGEKGEGWIRWALRKGDQLAPEYRSAVWSFARVYAPGLYTQVLAEKEAS